MLSSALPSFGPKATPWMLASIGWAMSLGMILVDPLRPPIFSFPTFILLLFMAGVVLGSFVMAVRNRNSSFEE